MDNRADTLNMLGVKPGDVVKFEGEPLPFMIMTVANYRHSYQITDEHALSIPGDELVAVREDGVSRQFVEESQFPYWTIVKRSEV